MENSRSTNNWDWQKQFKLKITIEKDSYVLVKFQNRKVRILPKENLEHIPYIRRS